MRGPSALALAVSSQPATLNAPALQGVVYSFPVTCKDGKWSIVQVGGGGHAGVCVGGGGGMNGEMNGGTNGELSMAEHGWLLRSRAGACCAGSTKPDMWSVRHTLAAAAVSSICSLRASPSPVARQGLSIDDKSAAKMKATGDELVRWACRACAACCAALAVHCTVQPWGAAVGLEAGLPQAARSLRPAPQGLCPALPFPISTVFHPCSKLLLVYFPPSPPGGGEGSGPGVPGRVNESGMDPRQPVQQA